MPSCSISTCRCTNAPEPVPLTEGVYDVIDELHDREGTAFEAMITDATRELFR